MYVGNNRPSRLRHSHLCMVGYIGAHAFRRRQTGTFADKRTDHLCPHQLRNAVLRPHASIFDKYRSTSSQSLFLQSFRHHGKDTRRIGLNRGGRKSVADNNLYIRVLDAFFFNQCLCLFVKLPPEIRSGQKNIFIGTACGDGKQPQLTG